MASSSADRDRLFGWIALQTRLIDRTQLATATQSRNDDRGQTLADHLSGRGDLDADARAAVETLVSYHLRQHGSRAEETLATLGIGPSGGETIDAPGQPGNIGAVTSGRQRFRVLRPHAQGGLGAVFVAIDEELHREVALKQILENHADNAASRARFLLEAEITGGLEHPGIVPVYGLGTDADGRPYYAMRFIRGETLAVALARFHSDEALQRDVGRRSLELRKLLRRFTDVCNAIEYAHSRGVLHRDIKPANVIVGQHGETLVVDWGLAKVMGGPDPAGDSAERAPVSPSVGAGAGGGTLPGSSMGTPAYMSPEQAEGDLEHLGRRSDVYSLGGTLYHLLTGKPTVDGPVREVLRAVHAGEITPPRRRDPRIDRALEAVCLKAIAKRPDDRYATAKALAEDVERWMADEPVSAWREPISRRARRWANRNRTAVATAAVAILAVVLGLSTVLIVQTQAKAEIARALRNETRASAALVAANGELNHSRAAMQARYELAVEAIKTFHTGVSEDFLLKEEKFKALQDRLLKSAADFYGKLGGLLGRETDFASRRALAQANFEVAGLTDKVGRKEAALAAHRSVLSAREALAAEPEADAEMKADLSRSLSAVASLLERTGRTDDAVSTYRRAEDLLATPDGSAPAPATVRAALANCRSRLGSLLNSKGRPADALIVLRQARADQEALAAAADAPGEALRDLSSTVNNLAIVLSEAGRTSEAEAEYRRALTIRQQQVDHNPSAADLRSRLAFSHSNLGALLIQTGRHQEADAEHRTALAIRRKLAEENPAVSEFRISLAYSHLNLGWMLSETERVREAEAEFRHALAIQRRLAEENPSVIEFHRDQALTHGNLGVVLWRTGRRPEAEAEYRQAVEIYQRLADSNPTVIDFRSSLALNRNNLGELLWRTGRRAEAEAECRAGLAIQRQLADEHPSIPFLRNAVGAGLTNLADLFRSLGRLAEARDGYEQAVAIGEALVREVPDETLYRSNLACTLRRRGLVRRDLGDAAGAAADARRALSLYNELPKKSGEQCYETACCHGALAGLAESPGAGVSTRAGPAEADLATDLLRRAAGMGYCDRETFCTEAALVSLRDREDFRLLLMDLAMPADPFSVAR
jgi:serine/threonine-protein kinase